MNQKLNNIKKVLVRFSSGRFSSATDAEVYRWLLDDEDHSEKEQAIQALWDESVRETARTEASGSQWDAIRASCGKAGSASAGRSIRFLRFWQSAAAVLLAGIFVLAFMKFEKPAIENDLVQEHTPIALTHSFLLPDGTQVQLNSESTLLYPDKFSGKERSVYLMGEASFKVAHDKEHPFVVKGDDFRITALGTEFNVSAYSNDDEVTATLLNGSVMVEYEDLQKKSILKPEQQLVYNRKSHEVSLRHPVLDDVTAWQRGELVFSRKTVADILRVLEHKYDYDFIYSSSTLSGDTYVFRFRDNAPLQEVMAVVRDVSGAIDYEIDGNICRVRAI